MRKAVYQRYILACLLISLFMLLATVSCSYPFASINSKSPMPDKLGQTWNPPRRAMKIIKKIQAPMTIDPAVFEGDISLAESINFALTNNPDTAISWAQMQAAVAQLGIARSDYFPTVSAHMDVTRQRIGANVNTFETLWLTSWGPGLNVDYTLWDFGTRAKKSESALQALFAVSWSYNQEIQNLVQTITNDYYENLYQKATLANDYQNVQDALLILDAAEKKLQVGVGDVTQLVQARTNYLQQELDLVTQKDNAASAHIQLAKNMGMPGNVEFSTQNFPCELPSKEFAKNLDELLEIAVQARPDICQAKATVKSKKAALNQARLDYLPKVKGSLNLDYRSYTGGFERNLNYTGEFQVNFPFFAGFNYRNKIREAKANFKQAEAELKKQQDTILQQVTTYFVNFQNAADRVEYSSSFLDSALEEFDVTLSNYRAGTGDIINVMQAQTSLSNARTKYTVSVKDLFVSLTNLAYATGSLIAPPVSSDWDSIYEFQGNAYD